MSDFDPQVLEICYPIEMIDLYVDLLERMLDTSCEQSPACSKCPCRVNFDPYKHGIDEMIKFSAYYCTLCKHFMGILGFLPCPCLQLGQKAAVTMARERIALWLCWRETNVE